MSIPSAGRSSSTPKPSIKDGKKSQAAQEGVFQVSGEGRSVHPHNDNPQYMSPEADHTANRPLDDWDIEVLEIENRYFDIVADLSGKSESGIPRSRLKQAVTTIRNSLSTLFNHYRQRVAHLVVEGRIEKQNADEVMARNNALSPILDELNELESSMQWQFGKKNQHASMAQLRTLMSKATGVISETKAQLNDSTNLPEAKQESTTSTLPDTTPLPSNPPPENPEQLLATLTQNVKQSTARAFKATLDSSVKELGSLLTLLPQWIQEAQASDEDAEVLATYQSVFNSAFEKLQSLALKTIDKKDIPSNQSTATQLFEQCRDMVLRIESVKNGKFDAWVASRIKNPKLKAIVAAIDQADNPELRLEAQQQLHHFLAENLQHYSRLEPILKLTLEKSRLQEQQAPEPCEDALKALASLSGRVKTTEDPEFTVKWMQAIEKADQELSYLQKLEQALPERILPVLTTSPKSAPHFLHLLNPVCRAFLAREPELVSSEVSRKLFSSMAELLEGRREQDALKRSSALMKVASENFSSPDFLSRILDEAKTFEEIHAISQSLYDWDIPLFEEVQQAARDLETVKMDFEVDGIEKGRDALIYLMSEYPDSIKEHAEKTSAKRFEELTDILRTSLTTHLQKIFASEKPTPELFEKDLNLALQGIAKVTLTPVEGKKDAVSCKVEITLTPETLNDKDFRAFLNSTTDPQKTIAEAFRKSLTNDRVHFDQLTRSWEVLPLPPELLNDYKTVFLKDFNLYHKAGQLAQENKETINSHVQVREQINAGVSRVTSALHGLENQLQTQHAKRRKKLKALQSHLTRLKSLTKELEKSPLANLSADTSKVAENLITMVSNKQIKPEQAVTILNPLHQVLETAEHQTTPADQRKIADVKKVPEALTHLLEKMDSTLRPRLLYKLFARKRVKAFEQARALVSVCEQCPNGARLNAAMIDHWLKTSGIEQQSRKDLQELASSLNRYSKQLVGWVER